MVAPLGKAENKEKFIANQTERLPDLSEWNTDDNKLIEISSAIVNESQQINKVFENQNKSAKLKQELSDIKTEQSYFEEQCINNNISDIKCKTDINSSLLLKLWTRFELQNKGINRIFNMILFLFCFGLNNRQYLKFKNDVIV